MKYVPIGNHFFIENRARFASLLKPGSLAIFNSNDVYPTNADGTFPFRQNNDLFYLSGIDQEETILILFPDAPERTYREMLFLRETNEHIAVWEGQKLNKKQAQKISGIASVFWLSDFESILTSVIFEAQHIYLNTNEHIRSSNAVETRDDRFVKWCRQRFPLHLYERSAPLLQSLRTIKTPAEIEMISKACNITEKAFHRILKTTKPGIKEYEIEAEMWYEFIRNGSRGPAYAPIIASGANACVLHYISNDNTCNDGELVLLDIGAEYGNYNADLSRTIPVNGRFNPRQKDVYQAVLNIFKEARTRLVPGNSLARLSKDVGEITQEELLKLGVLKSDDVKNQNPAAPAYRKYFMHGVSHFLGLDVHDVGDRHRSFEPGMIFTCEPGIYIPEEGIGIRLENDILITTGQPVDLMESIPIEAEEVEEIMNLGAS